MVRYPIQAFLADVIATTLSTHMVVLPNTVVRQMTLNWIVTVTLNDVMLTTCDVMLITRDVILITRDVILTMHDITVTLCDGMVISFDVTLTLIDRLTSVDRMSVDLSALAGFMSPVQVTAHFLATQCRYFNAVGGDIRRYFPLSKRQIVMTYRYAGGVVLAAVAVIVGRLDGGRRTETAKIGKELCADVYWRRGLEGAGVRVSRGGVGVGRGGQTAGTRARGLWYTKKKMLKKNRISSSS